ncbi:MAG: insulinase family protein [Actinomycetota bacterium]|nr:insulinase family protein [Actinomycetota bacterium]
MVDSAQSVQPAGGRGARPQRPGTTRVLSPGSDSSGVVKRSILPSGLRVVTESVPGVRSVTFGIWVGVGSRDETDKSAGSSHFLEHLLFKGTERRDALEIAAAMDAVGGEMNAFTAKEYTCYYARVLDTDLPLAVDVVCDMVASSVITAEDVEVERGVILEEIAMHDDDPADVVHDAFAAAVFGDAVLGRPVIGTVDTITAMRRGTIAGYYRKRYTAPVMVVSAAGNLEHSEVVRMVRRALRTTSLLAEDAEDAEPVGPRPGPSARRKTRGSGLVVTSRPTEQANLVLGTPGLARSDERRFALWVLNNALGGGMSSRLFQEVREKRGLAYSVYSFTSQYADAGLFGVYAGCQPSRVDEVLAVCREQLEAVATAGITEEELVRGKGQLKGSLVLGLEDTGSRMTRIGKSELTTGDLLDVEEVIRRVEAVTLDEVRDVAQAVLGQPVSLGAIGPLEDTDLRSAVA